MVEERLHVCARHSLRGVAGEGQLAEIVAIVIGARMAPRPDRQVQQAAALIFVLQRLVDRGTAVAVLLVPLADLDQRRDGQRPRRHPFVDRLARPEFGVGRVLEQLLDERIMLDAQAPGIIGHRSGLEIAGVIVAGAGRDAAALGLGRALRDGEVEAAGAEGAVVEPVVAHPAVDHRALRHRGLQRRMRVDLRRQRQEAEVGRADRPDLAVRFRHVLHQPVDRVIGVGAFVDAGVVERPGDRAVHHELPFANCAARGCPAGR